MSKLRRIGDRLGVPLAIWAVFAAPLALALAGLWAPRLAARRSARARRAYRSGAGPGRLRATGQRGPASGATPCFAVAGPCSIASGAGCPEECLRSDGYPQACLPRPVSWGRPCRERVLVARGLPEDEARALRRNDPGLQLALAAGPWGQSAGQVYLVDPWGNLVLRYPPGFAAAGSRAGPGASPASLRGRLRWARRGHSIAGRFEPRPSWPSWWWCSGPRCVCPMRASRARIGPAATGICGCPMPWPAPKRSRLAGRTGPCTRAARASRCSTATRRVSWVSWSSGSRRSPGGGAASGAWRPRSWGWWRFRLCLACGP